MITTPRGLRPLMPLTLLAAGLILPTAASAQEVFESGFDAHGFHLAAFDGDARDPYSVFRPGRMQQWDFYAATLTEYAMRPLSFTSGPAGDTTITPVLNHLVVENMVMGLTLHDRLRLDVGMPLYLYGQGPSGEALGTKIGDVRVGGMIALVRPTHDTRGGLGLGLVPWVDIPTGDDQVYLGNADVSGGGALAATYELDKLTLSGHVGYHAKPAITAYNIEGADALLTAVSIGYLFDSNTGLNFEALLTPPLAKNQNAGTEFPVETILSIRKRGDHGGMLSGGVAASLTDGVGAAPVRVFFGGGFGKLEPPVPPDLDGDGIPNDEDACFDDPEIFNDYKDEDGCPDFMGDVTLMGQIDGQPTDLSEITLVGPDGSRMVDPSNPTVNGIMPGTTYTAKVVAGGCMGGSTQLTIREGTNDVVVPLTRSLLGTITFEVKTLEDGQPIPDAVVQIKSDNRACAPTSGSELALGDQGTGRVEAGAGDHVVVIDIPQYALYRQKVNLEAGETEEVVVSLKKAKTRVTAQRIEIYEKVHFETGKAIIKPDSYALLDEVAEAVITHKQIKLMEVAGHTDDQGRLEDNQLLSQDRAQAVLDYLVGKGVDPARLQAKGYGETRTIDTNETAEGRAANRRVEFNILEQDTVLLED
jgi:outer membrane protein OmpA-like peptidoglycan-associated protein